MSARVRVRGHDRPTTNRRPLRGPMLRRWTLKARASSLAWPLR
jgi:hypothetical protein